MSSSSVAHLVLRSTCLALLAAFPAACSQKAPSTTTASEASGSAAPDAPLGAVTAPAATAADAAATACRFEGQPFVIDTRARLESSITLVKLPDDRLAVGYATGDVPKAAVIDPSSGKATSVEVDASHLPPKEDAKAQRVLHRVTPLEASNTKMRVAVDLTETRSDKTRLVRCGPADEEPIFAFQGRSLHDSSADGASETGDSASGAGDSEVRDCRTFSDPGGPFALASQPRREGGKYESRWVIGTPPGRTIADPLVEKRELKPGKDGAPRAERNTFEALAGVKVDGAGYVMAGRIDGQLHVARRRSELEPTGSVATFWPNAAVGSPSLASSGDTVSVVFALMGKQDLMGLTFSSGAAPKAPQEIALEDAPSGADRTSVTTAYLSRGDLAIAFAEGVTKTRRGRIALLDSQLRARGPLMDLTPNGANVQDVKLASLGEDRLLVAYLDLGAGSAPSLKGLVVTCK